MHERTRRRGSRTRDALQASFTVGGVLVWLAVGGTHGCSSRPPGPRPTEEWLNVLAPGMTAAEISEHIGVSGRWLSEAHEG